MKATLYVVPGSHPSMAGRLMLEHRGIACRRIDLLPALDKPMLRVAGATPLGGVRAAFDGQTGRASVQWPSQRRDHRAILIMATRDPA